MPINGQAEVTVIERCYQNYYSKWVILEVELVTARETPVASCKYSKWKRGWSGKLFSLTTVGVFFGVI